MTEEQITSLTYEFESVAKKLDFLSHFTSGYAELFHQRANCELAYAHALNSQCGQPVKTRHLIQKDIPLDRIEETMKGALKSFNEETLKVAQKHQEIGNIFLEQIAKPLDAMQRNIELNKRKIVNDFLGIDKKHKTLIKAAEKCQENYKKLVNDHKQVTTQLETNTNPSLIDKLFSKKNQLETKIQQAEVAYKQSVEKANQCGEETYGEPVKKMIRSAIELIKAQFEEMKNVMNVVSAQLGELLPVQESSFAKMKDEIAKIDFEKDLDEFIKNVGNAHSAYILAVKLETVGQPGEKKEEQPVEEKKEEVVEEKKEEVQQVEEKKEEQPVVEEENGSEPLDLN